MQQKLNAILGNPEMMSQIMNLAQGLGQESQSQDPEPQQPSMQIPAIDPSMLAKMAGFMQQSGIDNHQQTLLRALSPYLSCQRLEKLERAMRAARLAGVAGSLLGSGMLRNLGR